MFKRGRAEGWLRRPIEQLPVWAEFNGVKFNGIKIGLISGLEDRGSTVIADRDLVGAEDEEPLIVVPKDLVVSRENIEVIAKGDHHLKEVLDALGEFGRTTRGAVLMFLIMQATIACPDVKGVGLLNPLTEYIKFLPDELLPTFWTEEERELLTGTTLRPAVRAKLSSLLREFESVRTATEGIGWCAKYWWDEYNCQLTLEDWMRVDAIYRSRALEFPGVGDAMVPCIDMANHASGDATAALYEIDESGLGLQLRLLVGKNITKGGEVTITYGDDKGACESIFSYGFLEDKLSSAKTMFLDLDIPMEDPLRPAKIAVNTNPPGFRVTEKDGHFEWESAFVWLVLTNEEDGLNFRLKRTVDGDTEIEASWKDQELEDTSKLRTYLQQELLWDVYHLRAVVLIQNRIETQLQILQESPIPARDPSIREGPWRLAGRLHNLEFELLERAETYFEDQKATMFQSEIVQRYLGLVRDEVKEEEEEEVDFS